MIAAAVIKATPWWHYLTPNWFDVTVVLLLAFGFWRGRKRGMSKEALPTGMWIVAVAAAGFGYTPLGDLLLHTGYVKAIFGTSVNERTASYIISYLAIALVALIIHSLLKKFFKEKVSGSNTFGSGEYYLGTISGIIRYICILLFFLALINAPYYSAAEIAAQKAYNNRWYGGGLKGYNGDFIPTFPEIQAGIFKNSLIGPQIQNFLGALLIQTGGPLKPHGSKH